MRNVPKFTPMATIGVPTLCMIGLFLLPLYDRSPERLITRRPIALAAGLATIACIAYLTYAGAGTGSPNNAPNLPPPAGSDRRAEDDVPGRRDRRRRIRLRGLSPDRLERQQRSWATADPYRLTASGGRDRFHAEEPDRADAVVRKPGEDVAEEVRGSGRVPVGPSVARSFRRVGRPPAAFLCGTAGTLWPMADTSALPADPSARPQPQTGTLAEPQVQAMFDRIAGVYDRLNSVMTAGLHHTLARARSRAGAGRARGSQVLDVATGTGDLAFALARAIGPDGNVVGADFAEQMLEIARRKAAAGAVGPDSARVRFEQANALLLAARHERVRRGRRSASECATSPTSIRVCASSRAWCGPAVTS